MEWRLRPPTGPGFNCWQLCDGGKVIDSLQADGEGWYRDANDAPVSREWLKAKAAVESRARKGAK